MSLLGGAIIIAGTPGTGKSTVGRKLSELCNVDVINLSSVAIERGFVLMYDERRDTYIINEDKLIEYVVKLVNSYSGTLVIITHYPEIIPSSIVQGVYVLRTHPLVLEKRLAGRGWKEGKINENVMAEVLGVVINSAIEAFGEGKVYEIDTTNAKPEEIAQLICNSLSGVERLEPGSRIDWLTLIDPKDVLRFSNYAGSEDQ